MVSKRARQKVRKVIAGLSCVIFMQATLFPFVADAQVMAPAPMAVSVLPVLPLSPMPMLSAPVLVSTDVYPVANLSGACRWIEIDGKESYGWWPKNGVGLIETIWGVPGQLNGTDSAYAAGLSTRTKDAHHGDSADESFNPRVNVGGFAGFFKKELQFGAGKGVKCDCATEDQIKDSIRGFAAVYKGNWSYPLGQNCHSFQRALLRSSCLKEEK